MGLLKEESPVAAGLSVKVGSRPASRFYCTPARQQSQRAHDDDEQSTVLREYDPREALAEIDAERRAQRAASKTA